jgi:hypothetical protein
MPVRHRAAVFNDGPYLDPFTNGVQATPGAKVGIVTITLAFPAYVATKAYRIGDFVTSGGVNYISLVDQNVGSAPPSANWAATSPAPRSMAGWLPRHRHRPAGAAVLGAGGMGGRHGLCWHRPRRAGGGRLQSDRLPGGTLYYRRRSPRPAKSPAPT